MSFKVGDRVRIYSGTFGIKVGVVSQVSCCGEAVWVDTTDKQQYYGYIQQCRKLIPKKKPVKTSEVPGDMWKCPDYDSTDWKEGLRWRLNFILGWIRERERRGER